MYTDKKQRLIRMNDTPQGDGNPCRLKTVHFTSCFLIRMNDTPQGDGNFKILFSEYNLTFKIRMNDTPQGDGNLKFKSIITRFYIL